ncbi:hypothetical protein AAMO2058_000487700 [Amorphochlora amoebiformis]
MLQRIIWRGSLYQRQLFLLYSAQACTARRWLLSPPGQGGASDKDPDGKPVLAGISKSKDEVQAGNKNHLSGGGQGREKFEEADSNNDGVLSPEEFEKYLTRQEFYTKFQRRGFLRSMEFRQHLKDATDKTNELNRAEDEAMEMTEKLPRAPEMTERLPRATVYGEPTAWQLRALFMRSAVPFFGFGFVDNVIMITAGEMIDVKLGDTFHLTTLAAAGLGNLLSDVAGIGLGGVIEEGATKLGLPDPRMSIQQLNGRSSRIVRHLATVVGISLGCLAGMVPLLFINSGDPKTVGQ